MNEISRVFLLLCAVFHHHHSRLYQGLVRSSGAHSAVQSLPSLLAFQWQSSSLRNMVTPWILTRFILADLFSIFVCALFMPSAVIGWLGGSVVLVQASRDSSPVPLRCCAKVPGHPSLRCRQSTASEICQLTLPYCSAVLTKYVQSSGLRCWGSDGLELITRQSP